MPHNKVTIEWRRGVNGDDGTYTFNPNPFLTRVSPGKRTAIHTIPLLDGVVVQNLGNANRELVLRGVLYQKDFQWDSLETLRNNLRDGLSVGPGQLHLISPQRHIRYDGQITTEGIVFDVQQFSNIQDYSITILIPSGLELNVTETEQDIDSDAEIT